MSEHEQQRDELAPYLLGALSPGEAAELEQHIAACEECRAELEQLRPVVQALPESVERVEPPPRLRTRVMAEVQADVGKGRARARLSPGSRRHTTFLRPATAVAAVVLIAAATLAYAISNGGSPGEGVTTVSAGKAPGVTARLVSEGGAGTLHLANLGRLPSNKALQAWVQRGKRVERAGAAFVSHPNGTATTEIEDLEGVSTVMVTAEPRSGSAFPTTKPLVSVQVRQ